MHLGDFDEEEKTKMIYEREKKKAGTGPTAASSESWSNFSAQTEQKINRRGRENILTAIIRDVTIMPVDNGNQYQS